MDPKIIKKTQDSLGKIIKKPPLTEKLLSKPPFRFLHDVVTSVLKTTGFMEGLFTESELNSENVKEKDSKMAFLQKAIDMVSAVTGKPLAVKTAKIVAGHEPERTNELLQGLADAVNKNVDNEEYVKKVLKGSGGGGGSAKEERKEKDRTKSADRRKGRDNEEEKKDGERERSREKGDRDRKHDKDREEKGRKHEKDRDHKPERDREKGKEDRHKDRERESKTREKSRDGRDERHRDKSRKRDQSKEKENESPARVNGEKEEKHEPPSRLQRPASAKGSRRRREAQNHAALEDEEFQKPVVPSHEPVMGEGDLPPQVAAARQLARPSSARPAPPRPKQEASESEPAMRLGTGQPANLIVDDNDDDDEDLNFLVEESAPPPPEPDMTPSKPAEEDDAEHGALVKKMLESKKELEGGSLNQTGQPKKTEIERPVMSDAQRRKQREMVQKEVEKLRGSIQGLTRSANPLGKVMDYVQEDLDSMQQELDKWKSENAQHALDLKREMSVTDRAIEPLRQQLTELERAIGDQLDQIAATKANIIRNDQKIAKMLRGIAGS